MVGDHGPRLPPRCRGSLLTTDAQCESDSTTMKLHFVLAFAGLCAGPWVRNAGASSMHLAAKCRGHTCATTPDHPILDWNEEQGCHCVSHPCWSDNGVAHHCEDPVHPYLMFSYTAAGKLKCGCSAHPHYDSTYIAKELCPGEFCDDKDNTPVVDFDDQIKKCLCRSHPCWNIDGLRHSCNDPKFPILYYSEVEVDDEGGGKAIKQQCSCIAKFERERRTEL